MILLDTLQLILQLKWDYLEKSEVNRPISFEEIEYIVCYEIIRPLE